jgi:alpha-D-ribose 1-methylphosphonate 5-triphosphate synthase subunit PhnH
MEAVLDGGFADAPRDAAHAFRAAMDAMARPGRIARLQGARPPAPLSVAAGVLILTLCDPETPVHLAGEHDTTALRGWIAFHTGAQVVGRADAAFAVGTWEALLPLDGYRTGEAEYPDRSATLIVEMPALTAEGATLTGPGIRDTAHLSLPEAEAFRRNARLFPLGLDFFLTAGDRVAALPRTTRVG